MSTELHVLGLGGSLCSISAEPHWQLAQVKEAVSRQLGIPLLEQRLFEGDAELCEFTPCSSEFGRHLTLIRRPPQQASFLQRIADAERPSDVYQVMCSAPPEICEDRQVLAAAVRRNGWALTFAGGGLQ
ncbi:unnamed protein product, partial [Polarella glacialis]